MKVLILTNKVPFPATDGSSLAMASMANGLIQAGANVYMLSLNTKKHFKNAKEIEHHTPPHLNFTYVNVNTNITPINTGINLLSSKAFHVSRFYQKTFKKKLVQILSEHDFNWVQIDGLPMAVYLPVIRQNSHANISLRAHNVEHRIWEQQVNTEKSKLKKAYLNTQIKRLRQFETNTLAQIDALVPITKIDASLFKALGYKGKLITIACGIHTKQYELPKNLTTKYHAAYLASMDWAPNRTGVEWFIDNVLPMLQKEKPEIKIALAGYKMPKALLGKANTNLMVHKAVSSKTAFMAMADVAIVPLLAGSGMRIKVLEYMAMGKCVVSTSIGAEGIPVEHNNNILIADGAKEFANKILWALANPSKAEHIGENAKTFAQAHYDQGLLGEKLVHFYQQL